MPRHFKVSWQFSLQRLMLSIAFVAAAFALLRISDGPNLDDAVFYLMPCFGAAIGVFAGFEGAVLGAILALLLTFVIVFGVGTIAVHFL